MNKEIKAMWLEALKSGDYVQGVGYLNYMGKQCCLGVLCEVLIENNLCAIDKVKSNQDQAYEYNNYFSMCPSEVIDRCGIESNDVHELIRINDNLFDGHYTSVIPLIETL